MIEASAERAEGRGRATAGSRSTVMTIAAGAALAAVTAWLAVIAYRASFVVINLVDDDGYVIVSLRLFDQGAAIYSDVYSQYGPGLFTFLGGAIHLLGIDLMSDGSHWVNIGFWIGSTLLAGLAVLRLTASFPAALIALLATFLVLQADANEPLHPGAMIGFFLIAIIAVAAFVYERSPATAMGLIGALAMVVLSVKVNVGGLAFASILLACALTTPLLAARFWARVVGACLFVAVPLVLLAERLEDPDTLRFAVIVAASCAGVAFVGLGRPRATGPRGRALAWLAAGALAVLVLVSVVPIALGTAPGDLIDGWFLRPAETPGIQFGVLRLDPLSLVWAAVGLAGAAVCAFLVDVDGVEDGWPSIAVALGRVALGAAIVVTLVDGPAFAQFDELTRPLVVAGPFAWVVVLAPPGAPPRSRFIRLLIAALAVLQPLHAFPVPGTQLAWGQLLFVVVGCMCLADGAHELAASRLIASSRRAVARWVTTIALLGFAAWVAFGPLDSYADENSADYRGRVALDLPGAVRVRGAPDQVANLRELSAAIRRHCDTFLTLPGLNSLYLYTGEQPPAVLNGPWTYFFSSAEQRAVLDRVDDVERLCVVENRELQKFWAAFSGDGRPEQSEAERQAQREVERRPLVAFIRREFEPIGDYDGYVLMVRATAKPGPAVAATAGSPPGSGDARGTRRGR